MKMGVPSVPSDLVYRQFCRQFSNFSPSTQFNHSQPPLVATYHPPSPNHHCRITFVAVLSTALPFPPSRCPRFTHLCPCRQWGNSTQHTNEGELK